ncbi:hypothetical protein CcaCcLH18_02133 [Colletotrichum camelliae]|nr:hypothetical protein CcaCcLH18_02133 [Colletotrichum camelliae]
MASKLKSTTAEAAGIHCWELASLLNRAHRKTEFGDIPATAREGVYAKVTLQDLNEDVVRALGEWIVKPCGYLTLPERSDSCRGTIVFAVTERIWSKLRSESCITFVENIHHISPVTVSWVMDDKGKKEVAETLSGTSQVDESGPLDVINIYVDYGEGL